MIASFISTEGTYLEAKILIDGKEYFVMDEITLDSNSSPKIGDEFEVDLLTELADENWEEIFSGNPNKRIGLEHIKGWQYKAYGKITGINPVVVDCGLYKEEDVIDTNDKRVIGEFISFTIKRLGAYGNAI